MSPAAHIGVATDAEAARAVLERLTAGKRLFEARALLGRLAPDVRAAHHVLRLGSNARWQIGEREEALEDMRRLVAARGNDAWARERLVSHLVLIGRFEEAAETLRGARAGERPGARAALARARARIAAARFDFERAIPDLEEALRLDPKAARGAHLLAECALAVLDRPLARVAIEARARANAADGRPPDRWRLSYHGQILIEFDLDPDGSDRLSAFLAAPDGGDFDGIAGEVRRAPNLLGPAIAALVCARRTGRLESSAAAEEGPSRIPRRLFGFWDRPPPPPDVLEARARTRAHNPAWDHVFLDTAGALAFLAARFPPEVGRAFRLARPPARKADILRLAVLAAEGGAWLDADDIATGPIDALLPPGAGMVVFQDVFGPIANDFLAAAPGHPLVEAALAEACEAVLGYSNESIWLSTGPGVVTRRIAERLCLDALGDVEVLPFHRVRQILAIHVPMAYKDGARDWRRLIVAHAGA